MSNAIAHRGTGEFQVGRVKIIDELPTTEKPSSSMMVALRRGAIMRPSDDAMTYVESAAMKMWEMLETGVLTLQGVDKEGQIEERLIPITSEQWTAAFFKILEHMDGKPAQVLKTTDPGADNQDPDSLFEWRRRSVTIREETINRYGANADLYTVIDD